MDNIVESLGLIGRGILFWGSDILGNLSTYCKVTPTLLYTSPLWGMGGPPSRIPPYIRVFGGV